MLFEFPPGQVVLLRPDEGKDLFLAGILAHQGGGQTQAPSGLDVGGDAEDGSGQEVHLIVDDQPPILAVEEVEMWEVLGASRAVGQDLIGRHGDGAELLQLPGVLPDILRLERGLVQEFVYPLPGGHSAGSQD